MGWRYFLPVMLIAAVFACLLIGWAIAYSRDRRQREEDRIQADADARARAEFGPE